MNFEVKIGQDSIFKQKTSCIILPVFSESRLNEPLFELDRLCNGIISYHKKSKHLSSDEGKTFLLSDISELKADSILFVGCGKKDNFGPEVFQKSLSSAFQVLIDLNIPNATSFLSFFINNSISPYYASRFSVETAMTKLYKFDELKSIKTKANNFKKLSIVFPKSINIKEAKAGIKDGSAIGKGMNLARDLGNRPPNICTPSHLFSEAKKIQKTYKNIKVKALSKIEMKKLGMGAFLSVTQGAAEPPKFIIIEYSGSKKNDKPIVLCGKGITFDTGGISLKPPSAMDEMKFDMCGAASVMGVISSVGELQLPINLIVLIPACENMPGSSATRPGDIVKTMSGKTVEILNTDAEGRLILCDAITYGLKYRPKLLIDVATLTGACLLALGNFYSGLFSNDELLAKGLLEAGERSCDFAWRLPVHDIHRKALKSNFADFANIGGREAGASVAAAYLQQFAENTSWAHLDIAGSAWLSKANKGSTGRPVQLLVDFLLNI